jgi:hypothetical protein
MGKLPKYQSHKTVEAFKIEDMVCVSREGDWRLTGQGCDVTVNQAYMAKHKPKIGGYFVQYADGYKSWSPADAFEEGYSLIETDEAQAAS